MPTTRADVKNAKQYEALTDNGMSQSRAVWIANSPDASKHGGQNSGSGSSLRRGGTPAQRVAGRTGGKAAAKKS